MSDHTELCSNLYANPEGYAKEAVALIERQAARIAELEAATGCFTLTGKQIRDLVAMCGRVVECSDSDLKIEVCRNDTTILDDAYLPTTYQAIAFFPDYPDEGVFGLGDPVASESAPFGEPKP